jgi:hypothetical protein
VNQVERWFAEITEKRIRRGSFDSVPSLEKAIQEYLNQNNENRRPFVWTADADMILGKIQRLCELTYNSGHARFMRSLSITFDASQVEHVLRRHLSPDLRQDHIVVEIDPLRIEVTSSWIEDKEPDQLNRHTPARRRQTAIFSLMRRVNLNFPYGHAGQIALGVDCDFEVGNARANV